MEKVINQISKFFLYIAITLFFTCNDDYKHEPLGKPGSAPPLAVKSASVRHNLPGGAVIEFDVSGNIDAHYVKAVYSVTVDKQSEVIVSSYVDSLEIKGLGDTNERKVLLYVVNSREQMSPPVEVTIQPLQPPLEQIFGTLTYFEDFGGFGVKFRNDYSEKFSINILVKDSTGTYINYDAFFTGLITGQYVVRGLPPVIQEFGVFLRDRWNNFSDTLLFSIIPLPETYFDKKLFKYLSVAGDTEWYAWASQPEFAWNDIVSESDYVHCWTGEPWPHNFTMNLGVTGVLSRFRFWQRPGSTILYQHGGPVHYRIWGRADDPGDGNAADIWQGWTMILECESIKPSGLPFPQFTSDDYDFAMAGEEFYFPSGMEPVRYLRFEFLDSWSGMELTGIGELSFWGTIVE